MRAGNGDVRLTIGGFTADIAGQAFAVVDIAAAQDLFRRGGTLTRIDVRLAAGADPAAVRARIAAKLPPGVVVVPPADSVRSTARLSRAYRVNLNVLALVALFTGALLVYSMQALSVARRRAQFALLRTLGLARARLLGLVLGEATAIGVAGALIGLPLGYAFAAFALAHFGGRPRRRASFAVPRRARASTSPARCCSVRWASVPRSPAASCRRARPRVRNRRRR